MHSTIARTSIFCCLSIAVILAESIPEGDYHSQNSKYSDSGSEDEDQRPAVTPGSRTLDPEVADQLEGNGWLDVIPGTPGKDYPNYDNIPETSFTCDGKTVGGYYADIEARCQVFHVCDTGGLKSTFVCPSGSIFNQKYLVCDWWYDFECDDATDLYSLNEKVNRGGTGSGPGGPGWLEENIEDAGQNYDGQVFPKGQNSDLSLAGTGEGAAGYARTGSKGYQSNADDGDDREKRYGGGTREKNLNRKNPESSEPVENEEELDEEVGVTDNFRKQNNPAVNSGINYRSKDSKTDNFRYGNDEGRGRGNGFSEHRNSRVGDANYSRSFRARSARPGGHDYGHNSDSDDLELPDKNSSSKVNPGGTSPPSPGSNDNGYGIPGVIGGGVRPKVVQGRQRNSGGLPGGLGNGYPSPGRSGELPGSDRIGIAIAITPGERRTPVHDEADQRFAVVNSRADNAISTINRRTYEGDDRRPEIDSRDNQLADNGKYSEMDDRYNRQGRCDHRHKNEGKNYSDDYLVGIVPGDDSQPDGTNFGQVKKEKRRYLPIL